MLGSLQAVRSLHFPLLCLFLCACTSDVLFPIFLYGMDKNFRLHISKKSDKLMLSKLKLNNCGIFKILTVLFNLI